MFSKEEILAQLRQGADASDIAQKMADEINDAVHAYEAEQAAAKIDRVRREDARAVVIALSDFFAKYMDEEIMSDADIDEATDAMLEMIDHLKELKGAIKELEVHIEKADRKPNGPKELDDEIIRKFIASL